MVIEAQDALLAPVRALFEEGQAAGHCPDLDPADATTAVMGALAMVAMRHTLNNDFNPDEVADALIPCLVDGLGGRSASAVGVAARTASRPAGRRGR